MAWLIWIVCAALLTAVIVLSVRLYLVKKAAREIKTELAEKLRGDTNTLICISSQDKDMRGLAVSLNEQLIILRKEQLKYEQGNTELKEAVTNISHDLRTPLTAICGYLDLLEREELPENANRYLDIIRERTGVMRNLTEEMFDYSVLISKNETPLEDVNITAVLEQSVSAFYAVLKGRDITPDIIIPEKKVVCRCNEKALLRIFENIISNAVKYSNGDLRIELTETGEVSFINHSSALSKTDIGKLFDRYFTVETADRSTGLGLSIAKNLTEKTGGKIYADYQKGVLKITVVFNSK